MAIDIITRGMIEESYGDISHEIEQNKTDISQLFDITKGGETVSGSSAYTINNAVDYPLMGLNMYGKSIQQQYSGKNLFDFNAWKDSISSVTNGTAVYGKNSVKLTASSNDCFALGTTYYIAVKPKTTYTLSWNANNIEGLVVVYMNGMTVIPSSVNNAIAKTNTFTTKADTTSISVQFGVQNAGESITYSNIQLEVGETATSYEPYVGGIPAPNPNYPQDIKNVGDNGFDIITKDDKHFNLLSVRDSGGDIITKQPVSTVVKIGEKATFTVAASGTGLTYLWQWSADGTTWKNTSTTTASYTVTPSASFNGYKYRCVVTDSSGKSVISDEATLYVLADDYEITTASIATEALPLCGIPVESGGNYTDSNGQQWITDELIYNADGTGKIIKHTAKYTFTGNENFAFRNNDNGRCVYALANFLQYKYYSRTHAVSDKYLCIDTVNGASVAISNLKIGEICFYYDKNFPTPPNTAMYFGSSCTTLADFKSEIAGSVIIYPLATPQEIELTAAEVDALRNLQTFDGVTNISNSAGADMSVKYCTNKALSEYVLPITKGLQAQIDELRAAVLSLGGNV